MIHELSVQLVNKINQQQQLDEDDFDQYVFGTEVFLITVIKWTSLLGLGALLGYFWESFVFTVSFTLLRNQAGGFHSNSLWTCLVGTIALMLATMYGVQLISGQAALLLQIVLLATTVLLVFLYAPVDTPNKRLDEEERKRYRKQSRYLVIGGSLLILSSNLLFVSISTIAAIAFFLEALTLAPIGGKET